MVGCVTQVKELHRIGHGLRHGHVIPFRMSTRPVARACLWPCETDGLAIRAFVL
ncbi:hypothetical protein F383_20204 [Gossypium arboreum]|uniref:Uncharacterized protein n=1 Tax=Gossypium arboreum TaxID=29729 RepID=A0A0B0NKW1_GOSAR|nr:hypothetical protein F383_20204 [Gossypium arboreum]